MSRNNRYTVEYKASIDRFVIRENITNSLLKNKKGSVKIFASERAAKNSLKRQREKHLLERFFESYQDLEDHDKELLEAAEAWWYEVKGLIS